MSEPNRSLRAELIAARQHAYTADAQRAEMEAELLEARAAAQRANSRAARTQAEATVSHMAVAEVRRFCQMVIDDSIRTQAREQAQDTLAVLDAITPDTALPGDAAWHSVWLYGDWHWLTKNMTTPEREHAADAIARYDAVLAAMDGEDRTEPEDLRWWRD
ncbi:hypothetical protein [Streptomyces olivaceiscleroticus]|uniref:Uncharacterized protein n=1 Tax=Streptomyces olivaceiscleroticus TaxID=68245 RepID=A0ABP3LIQ4_9ACTN